MSKPLQKHISKSIKVLRDHVRQLDAIEKYSGELHENTICRPEPGDLPAAGAELLHRVYSKCRADGGDKEYCSKIAWTAVGNAGYKSLDVTKVLKSVNNILQKAMVPNSPVEEPLVEQPQNKTKRFSILNDEVNKADHEEGDKMMIYGRPYTWHGGKFVPDDGPSAIEGGPFDPDKDKPKEEPKKKHASDVWDEDLTVSERDAITSMMKFDDSPVDLDKIHTAIEKFGGKPLEMSYYDKLDFIKEKHAEITGDKPKKLDVREDEADSLTKLMHDRDLSGYDSDKIMAFLERHGMDESDVATTSKDKIKEWIEEHGGLDISDEKGKPKSVFDMLTSDEKELVDKPISGESIAGMHETSKVIDVVRLMGGDPDHMTWEDMTDFVKDKKKKEDEKGKPKELTEDEKVVEFKRWKSERLKRGQTEQNG